MKNGAFALRLELPKGVKARLELPHNGTLHIESGAARVVESPSGLILETEDAHLRLRVEK